MVGGRPPGPAPVCLSTRVCMSGGLWATQLAGCAQHIPSSSYLLLLSAPSRTVAPNVREMGGKA